MPLPPSVPSRQLRHRRTIAVQVFARPDDLWEVDALLTDVKTRDAHLAGGIRPAGVPIHHMLLRLVVDRDLTILASGAESQETPYPGACDDHGDAYGRLAGLNLLNGFRWALRESVGGVLGCTHLTELAMLLPTAVVQAFAGEVIDVRGDSHGASRPFQIDRCHALRSDGAAVMRYYPRWYRPDPDALTPAAQDAV